MPTASTLKSASASSGRGRRPTPAAWLGAGFIPAHTLPEHLRITSGVNWLGPGRHVITYPLRAGQLIKLRPGVVEQADWARRGILTLIVPRRMCQ